MNVVYKAIILLCLFSFKLESTPSRSNRLWKLYHMHLSAKVISSFKNSLQATHGGQQGCNHDAQFFSRKTHGQHWPQVTDPPQIHGPAAFSSFRAPWYCISMARTGSKILEPLHMKWPYHELELDLKYPEAQSEGWYSFDDVQPVRFQICQPQKHDAFHILVTHSFPTSTFSSELEGSKIASPEIRFVHGQTAPAESRNWRSVPSGFWAVVPIKAV